MLREITEPFRQINLEINDLCENVFYQWLHGYIQPSNLFSALSVSKNHEIIFS